MKNLIIIAMALISIQAIGQGEKKENTNRPERAHKMSQLSAEDMATLQTKKMTLHLDLNEAQQIKIKAINLENAKLRKAKMEAHKAKKESGEMQKPTQEERLKMANDKLDHQIAMKAKMKTILNAEQFAKWEKAQARMNHSKKGMKKHDGKRTHTKTKEQE